VTSLADSYAYCQALARCAGTNFYYSFLTLPRDRFRAMCALYAFMRITDDLGDSDQPISVRAAELAAWRQELQRALDTGASERHVLNAIVDVVARYGIPVEYLTDVIDGVEMDLHPVSIETFDQLSEYCYHVAGAVGLACIHIWGFRDPLAIPRAIDCGLAFQLTNILRDVREDAGRGRVYLPQEDLQRFGCTREDFEAGRPSPRFRDLMRFEAERANGYFVRARELFPYLSSPGQPILDAMLGIYGGLLGEIEHRDYDVLSRRVSLSRWKKLSITAGAIVRRKFLRRETG
jgi:phytoene synthase